MTLDEGTREILVLLITTSGTVAVAYFKTHPGPNTRRIQQEQDEDRAAGNAVRAQDRNDPGA